MLSSWLRNLFTMELFDTFELDSGFGLVCLFIALVGLAGNWRLFEKCNQPGWAALLPGFNVVVTMRVLGRPSKNALYFLIPGYNLYFYFKIILELARTFDKRSRVDVILACLFNIFYIVNLGLSEEEDYSGPIYSSERPSAEGEHRMTAVA